jgi:signal peptidase I
MRDSVWRRRALVVAGVMTCGVMRSGLRPGVVMGNSMSPTLRPGDWFLLDVEAYQERPPRRGEIVVFRHRGVTYIKRVLGGEGDTVCLLETREPDGVWLSPVEPGMLGRARRLCRLGPSWRLKEFPVPRGHVYVIGDMVSASMDSRSLGPIPLREIRGRVCLAPVRADPAWRPIPHLPIGPASRQRHYAPRSAAS